MSAAYLARDWRCALALAAFAALAAGQPLAAESVYVIEQIVVNVNSAPDASGERIATVKSGERLEVIERVRDQVHVRLGGGGEGWIRASYLSADEPLRVRLAQRDAELARLKDDVSRLQVQLGAARAPPATAARPPGAGATPAPGGEIAGSSAAAATPAPAPEDPAAAAPAALFASPSDEAPRRVWPWALGCAIVSLGVGFVLGAAVLDRHIRRKYGGLRIY